MRCADCNRPIPAGLDACPEDGGLALGSVTEALAAGPVALTQVVRVMQEVLSQLADLHVTGVAHGALGPEAVLFRQRGSQVIVRLGDGGPTQAPYLAPEGAGEPAADMFAVGVLFHHMITGVQPWPGRLPSLMQERLQDVPEALDALIQQLASPHPAERPHDLRAACEVLENLELDSTLSGARLAAVREAMEEAGPARQVTLSSPHAPAADPTGDTFIRDRSDFEAEIRASDEVDASPEGFADTVIGSREQIEAEHDVQDTLLGMPDDSARRALASLDVQTELLAESQVAPSKVRWVLAGVALGVFVGGIVAAFTLSG